jgi:RNA polymerase sigma-70 factor (sigma-E family)
VSEALRRIPASGSGARPATEADDAFRDLYRSERDKLVRLAYLLTGSQAAAEDLVQDVFIKAHARLGDVDQPTAYLRRAVTNACWSWHRRRQVEARHLDRRPAVVSGEHDIEMWDALARLSPRRRSVLVLRYYLDLPEQETADALGWRIGTVKSTAHRALQDLRRMLEP